MYLKQLSICREYIASPTKEFCKEKYIIIKEFAGPLETIHRAVGLRTAQYWNHCPVHYTVLPRMILDASDDQEKANRQL